MTQKPLPTLDVSTTMLMGCVAEEASRRAPRVTVPQ